MTGSSTLHIGLLIVSDRASRGVYEDRGGPALRAYLDDALAVPWEAVERIIPDDRSVIEDTLAGLCDGGCALVLTTGGTGPAPRDVTPEATAAVCDKLLPGFGEAMRRASLEKVPTAILSRQTAGVRGSTLVINLPGQPRAIRECLDAVFAAVPHAVRLLGGPAFETKAPAYRPPDHGAGPA